MAAAHSLVLCSKAIGRPAARMHQAFGKPLPALLLRTAKRHSLPFQQVPGRPRLTAASNTRGSAAAACACATSTAEAPAHSLASSLHTGGIYATLKARGLVQDCTNAEELERLTAQGPVAVYCGFDPTADSLHLGNLLGIIVLTWFRRHGHTPVALLGGATGRVGDPSGKSTERPILSEEDIDRNIASIRALLERLMLCGDAGGPKPLFINNLDWFGPMPLLQFLREVGKSARLGAMLSKDAVKSRMEADGEGISFTEFTYQLLQGYDFVHLARHYGVRIQIGGSDQWGNLVAGTDLLRKLDGSEAPQCLGLTFPLLTDSQGRKFGKSEGGAIWLDANKFSPFKLYQHLYANVGDVEVCRFLRMLTFLPLEEINALQAAMQSGDYVPNTAQRRLAEAVTLFVHGQEGLQLALAATQALAPGSETRLDAATLEAIAEDAPSASLKRSSVVGCSLADVIVAAGMQPSKAAVRRLIKGGGVRVNNAKIAEELHMLSEDDLIDGRLVLLATGKKNKLLLRVL